MLQTLLTAYHKLKIQWEKIMSCRAALSKIVWQTAADSWMAAWMGSDRL